LQETDGLRDFETFVPKKIFGPKETEEEKSGEDYKTRSFIICAPYQILLG
jgi:hypothetical protein